MTPRFSKPRQHDVALEADKAVKLTANSQHLNDVHDPLASVPPEIASTILEYAADRASSYKGSIIDLVLHANAPPTRPLELAAVCRRWRDIAFADPKLWNCVFIRRATKPWNLKHTLVEEWLARSGALPLFIVLSWDLPSPEAVSPVVEVLGDVLLIIKALCACISRWKAIVINLPPPLAEHFKVGYSAIHDLDFIMLGQIGGQLDMLASESDTARMVLRPIRASIIGLSGLSGLSWANLTNLDLIGTSVLVLFSIVKQAPQLKDLAVMNYMSPPEETMGTLNSVIMQNLQNLQVENPPDEGKSLLQKISTPSLRSLSLHSLVSQEMPISNDSLTILSEFLLHPDMKLRDLRIRDCGIAEHELITLLEGLPTLHTLDIDNKIDEGPVALSDVFLDHLVSSISSDQSATFLPNLSGLYYSGKRSFSWRACADVLDTHSRHDDTDLKIRRLKFVSVVNIIPDTPHASELEQDLIDEESLRRFIALPADSIGVELDQDLVEYSLNCHGIVDARKRPHLFGNYELFQ